MSRAIFLRAEPSVHICSLIIPCTGKPCSAQACEANSVNLDIDGACRSARGRLHAFVRYFYSRVSSGRSFLPNRAPRQIMCCFSLRNKQYRFIYIWCLQKFKRRAACVRQIFSLPWVPCAQKFLPNSVHRQIMHHLSPRSKSRKFRYICYMQKYRTQATRVRLIF